MRPCHGTAEHLMKASLESLPATTRHSASALVPASSTLVALATDITVREGIMEMPGELPLYHGGKVAGGARIAWRLVGPATAPVVCALGGISANRRVCLAEDARQEWWSQIAGPERPLDVN